MRFSLGENFLPPALFGAFLALCVTGPAMYKLHTNMPLPVGVLDIAGLSNEFTEMVQAGPGTTDEKSKKMATYSKSLESEILQVAKDCRCVLVVKAAVMGDAAIDYTSTVRTRLKK
jgi:hypothetical protein